MSALVLDASVALSWVLHEQEEYASIAVQAAFADGAHVPSLWVYEIQNVLALITRRGRLTLNDARTACSAIASIPTQVHAPKGLGREFSLGVQSGLTAYDASYLCIAQDLQLPIATLDEELSRAAQILGITAFHA